MRKIDSLLSEYAESHQTRFNKTVHYICVPAIFFSLIGLLSCISLEDFFDSFTPFWMHPYLHLGTLVIVCGLLYYLSLSFTFFLGMIFFSACVLFGIHIIDNLNFAPLWLIMLAIFFIAWIFQFIGHKHDGKKPSFLKDLQFLMIGPVWTLSHLFEFLKIKI